MDVNCPVCDRKLSSSGLDDLSRALSEHLVDEHGHSSLKVKEAPRTNSPLGSETIEECVTRTFSDTMCKVESEESKALKEKVTQWKYPRVGPTGERGTAFMLPAEMFTMVMHPLLSLRPFELLVISIISPIPIRCWMYHPTN